MMPAESAVYVAELEDLIAQVDSELSLTPDSIDLWGQRVNLMLDLAQRLGTAVVIATHARGLVRGLRTLDAAPLQSVYGSSFT